MSILTCLRRISLREATQHQRCRPLWVVVAFLLAILFTRTLTDGLAAQVVSPVATDTPAAEVTATASGGQPTASNEPSASVPSETVAQLPVAGNLAADQIKALVRARILALIRARIALSNAQETDSEETVLLPMVMGGAMTPSTANLTIVPAATVTTIAMMTPDTAHGREEATPTPVIEDAPTEPTATATPLRAVAALAEPTPDGSPRTAQVSILMYHYLSEPPADANIYRRDLSVAPSLFAQHLDRLLAEGYTTIRLDDLLLNLTQGAPLPPKPVILTFDDGYRDNYINAFPLLKERGMTATFFIVTDFIDEQRPEYLSWDMVREMYAGGMAIESHGRNHASLANRDADYLVWQALGSLETIEFELGVRPRFVSYPAGDYDENTIRIFQSANYWAGVTTKQGATHSSGDLFQLRRVRVRGTTTADDLVGLLAIEW
ncbi:polysaccharide deacetylase family protein [bacterium]|nr:polysaccharide deacetylase family protein [bacterium]